MASLKHQAPSSNMQRITKCQIPTLKGLWQRPIRFEAEMPEAATLPMHLVAADVRRLYLIPMKKLEPPYVGCYGSGAQCASEVPGILSGLGTFPGPSQASSLRDQKF